MRVRGVYIGFKKHGLVEFRQEIRQEIRLETLIGNCLILGTLHFLPKSLAIFLTISHLKTDFNLSSHLDLCNRSFRSCYFCRPTEVEHNFSLWIATVFVNISAGFLLPWIFSNISTSSSNKDLIK